MKKYIIIFTLAFCTLFSSCTKDYLDTRPATGVSTSTVNSSVKNLNSALMALYTELAVYTGVGLSEFKGISYFNIYNDFVANIMTQFKEPSTAAYWISADIFQAHTSGNNGTPIVSSPWYFGYHMIMRINAVVVGIRNIEPSEDDKELHSSVLAQSLSLRALMYQNLNLNYSHRYDEATAATELSVPLRKDVSTTDLARNTQKEVAVFILQDLNDAITAFGTAGDINGESAAYMNINAARLLKMRMLMYMGQPDEVLIVAQELLSNTTKTIMGTAEYAKGFNSHENPEWIYATVNNGDVGQTWYSIFWYLSKNYWCNGSYEPRGLNLMHLFGMHPGDAGDTEKFEGAIPDTRNLVMDPSDARYKYFITDTADEIKANGPWKYINDGIITSDTYWATLVPGVSGKFSVPDPAFISVSIVLMRLAEVYYMAAEAASLTNDDVLARQYLTETVIKYDPDFSTTESGANLRTMIANYKAVDMFGEGRSLEDVKRRGDWMYRFDKYCMSLQPVYAQYKSKAPYHSSVNADPVILDYTTLPIPKQALDNNPLLVP